MKFWLRSVLLVVFAGPLGFASAGDDFAVALRVRPADFCTQPLLRCVPWEWGLPEGLSPRRLMNAGVEELTVYAGPGLADGSIVWAAGARLRDDASLPEVIARWNDAAVPPIKSDETITRAAAVRPGAVAELPAGTFLSPSRLYGTRSFIDKVGRPSEEGVDVGNIDPRRAYVQGASLARAVFRFEGVDDDSLTDGGLRFRLEPDVFHSSDFPLDGPTGGRVTISVRLENPETGVTTAPMLRLVRSFDVRDLTIPRDVEVLEDGQTRPGELRNDLISGGRVNVEIGVVDANQYVGFGSRDVWLRKPALEYAVQEGRTLWVAGRQSPAAVVALKSGVIGSDMSVSTEGAAALIVRGDTPRRRAVIRELAEALGLSDRFVGGVRSLSGSLFLDDGFRLNAAVTFKDEVDASDAAETVRVAQARVKPEATEQLAVIVELSDTIANLAGIIFGIDLTTRGDRPERRVADAAEWLSEISGRLSVEDDGSDLRLSLILPDTMFQPAGEGPLGVATWAIHQGRILREYERFGGHLRMLDSATSVSGDHPAVRARAAWEEAFNAREQFDGFDDRYRRARGGLVRHLEAAEAGGPHRADDVWAVAVILSFPFALELSASFAADEPLRRRVIGLIDEPVEDETPAWLATRLFEQVLASPGGPPPLVTQPIAGPGWAWTVVGQTADREGRFEQADAAWERSDAIFAPLRGGSGRPGGPAVERALFGGPAEEAHAETMPQVRAARRAAFRADALLESGGETGDPDSLLNAAAAYRSACEKFAAAAAADRERVMPLLNEARVVRRRAVEACELVGERTDDLPDF